MNHSFNYVRFVSSYKFKYPTSYGWENGVSNNPTSFINELSCLKINRRVDSINLAYREIGSSCMKDNPVGLYYASVGVECISISKARVLVNPTSKKYNSIYGEQHYILESILILLGYSYSPNWVLNNDSINPLDLKYIPYLDGAPKVAYSEYDEINDIFDPVIDF